MSMKLKELELPNGWIENERFADSLVGVAAAYKTEDNQFWIEVAERGEDDEHPFKVELRRTVAGQPETVEVKHKLAEDYEDAEEKVLELSEDAA